MPTTVVASSRPLSLAIITAPRHYLWQSRLWSYGPYAREIDLWADLFDRISLVGPLRREQPPADAIAFERTNIVVEPILETGGDRLWNKLAQLVLAPWVLSQLAHRIRNADAVHIRGPSNLALLASLIAPFLRRPMVAKYAGQWRSYPSERRLVAFQRWLYRNWFRGPVTVYGKLDHDPPHIVDFFTSMLTQQQIDTAVAATSGKQFHHPFRVLFSGRLYVGKGLLELIEAVGKLAGRTAIELRIVGDGPLGPSAKELVEELHIDQAVQFLGAMPHEQALQQFAWADALVLASRHEGWPKVLTEAMVHHCLCLAPDAGIMGKMVAQRGCVLQGLDPAGIAATLERVTAQREHFHALLPAAAAWAASYSMEGLRSAIAQVLAQHWNLGIEERIR